MNDILPDSRLKVNHTPKNMVQGPGGMWVPVFCAHCGVEGGLVPEKNMTFAFWMCNPCFEKNGHITAVMMVPDKVFYDQIEQEQRESFGRLLDHNELLEVLAEDSTPLATLLKEAR